MLVGHLPAARAQEENVGAGVFDCSFWLNAESAEKSPPGLMTTSIASWSAGYMAAAKAYGNISLPEDAYSITTARRWLDFYCPLHSSERIVDAIRVLIEQNGRPLPHAGR